jgi:hypothetical protein
LGPAWGCLTLSAHLPACPGNSHLQQTRSRSRQLHQPAARNDGGATRRLCFFRDFKSGNPTEDAVVPEQVPGRTTWPNGVHPPSADRIMHGTMRQPIPPLFPLADFDLLGLHLVRERCEVPAGWIEGVSANIGARCLLRAGSAVGSRQPTTTHATPLTLVIHPTRSRSSRSSSTRRRRI